MVGAHYSGVDLVMVLDLPNIPPDQNLAGDPND